MLLSIASVAYFGFFRKGCICSVGAIQNVVLCLVHPQYVVSFGVIAIFFLPLIMALFFGRIFCSGVCPLGALLGIVFGASSLYLVLKVGITVSASIPVAVISLTLFRLFSKLGIRDSTILENNITQTAGSANAIPTTFRSSPWRSH